MTRTATALIGFVAAISASALLAAGPRSDPAGGGVSPFDPAAGTAVTAVLLGDPGTSYFPEQFPHRGHRGVEPAEQAPTF